MPAIRVRPRRGRASAFGLLGLFAAFWCARPAAAVAQTAADPPPAYVFEYSTVPMTRNAALVDAATGLIERGTDWVVDSFARGLFARRSTGGFFARLGRWLAFDFFVEGFGVAAAHEYGHATRAGETGREAQVVLGSFNHSFFRTRGAPLAPLESVSIFSGGLEGEQVLAERIGDRIHARGTATEGDLTALFMTAYGSVSYILDTLGESRLATPDRLLNGGEPGRPGDPAQYVLGLTAARLSQPAFRPADVARLFPEIQANARSIRRRSLLNLLDYGYVTIGAGLFRDYLWRGERSVPVRWIALGPVSIVPGLSYRLTPAGPETRVRSRYKFGAGTGDAYVRWTEPLAPGSSRLAGAGGEYQPARVRGVEPRVAFDVWRNPDGTTRLRGEAGATIGARPGDRLVFSAALGAKGPGYVTGYPIKSGPYFSIGAGLRF